MATRRPPVAEEIAVARTLGLAYPKLREFTGGMYRAAIAAGPDKRAPLELVARALGGIVSAPFGTKPWTEGRCGRSSRQCILARAC